MKNTLQPLGIGIAWAVRSQWHQVCKTRTAPAILSPGVGVGIGGASPWATGCLETKRTGALACSQRERAIELTKRERRLSVNTAASGVFCSQPGAQRSGASETTVHLPAHGYFLCPCFTPLHPGIPAPLSHHPLAPTPLSRHFCAPKALPLASPHSLSLDPLIS